MESLTVWSLDPSPDLTPTHTCQINVNNYLVLVRIWNPIWISILDFLNVLFSAHFLLGTCSLSLALGTLRTWFSCLGHYGFQLALFPVLSWSCSVAIPQLSLASFGLFFIQSFCSHLCPWLQLSLLPLQANNALKMTSTRFSLLKYFFCIPCSPVPLRLSQETKAYCCKEGNKRYCL